MASLEIAKIKDDSIAEILSAICIEEARALRQKMLALRGREPMIYTSWSFFSHNLETPVFGEMTVPSTEGAITYGYKARIFGSSPEVFIGPSANDFLSNPAAYADYSGGLLSINKVGINDQNQTIFSDSLAHFDISTGRIYDEELRDKGHKLVDEDKAAELRVVLEYGLLKLGMSPRKIKKIASSSY